MWYHLCGLQEPPTILDGAWCYPEPLNRETLRNCVTFATGKGITVRVVEAKRR